jgi:hypothetical protein
MNPLVIGLGKYVIGSAVGIGCYYIATQVQQTAIDRVLTNPNLKSLSGTCTKSSFSFTAEFYRNQPAQQAQAQMMTPQQHQVRMIPQQPYQIPAANTPVQNQMPMRSNPEYYGLTYDLQSGQMYRTELY